MVRITAEGSVYIKILYWGPSGCGKTTAVDTLYRMCKETNKDIKPTGNLTKISMASGSTLYFDRGIFQSTKPKSQGRIFYHVYTVAGQREFLPIRKRIFKGTDGVLFVFDSQTHLFEENMESLRELKDITKGRLITEIPLIILLNKQDLTDVIGEDDAKQILLKEELWYPPENEMHIWNPIIYETCALYHIQRNIYRSLSECIRRTGLYQIYGDGKAPLGKNFENKLNN